MINRVSALCLLVLFSWNSHAEPLTTESIDKWMGAFPHFNSVLQPVQRDIKRHIRDHQGYRMSQHTASPEQLATWTLEATRSVGVYDDYLASIQAQGYSNPNTPIAMTHQVMAAVRALYSNNNTPDAKTIQPYVEKIMGMMNPN